MLVLRHSCVRFIGAGTRISHLERRFREFEVKGFPSRLLKIAAHHAQYEQFSRTWCRHDARSGCRNKWATSYVSFLESRVLESHPLRRIRALLDEALDSMSRDFDRVYAGGGRISIAPERLVRALVLQVLYSIRSERLLVEQLDYNLLFRWFVGLAIDERVWDH